MVVTALPATWDTWVWHENARLPSIWTMQAPHNPVPQPNLVPVSLSSSRITHRSGVCGGASDCAALPLILKSKAIGSSIAPRGLGRRCHPPCTASMRLHRSNSSLFLPLIMWSDNVERQSERVAHLFCAAAVNHRQGRLGAP